MIIREVSVKTPAFPYEVCEPGSCGSITVTENPRLINSTAVQIPTIPAPIITIFFIYEINLVELKYFDKYKNLLSDHYSLLKNISF